MSDAQPTVRVDDIDRVFDLLEAAIEDDTLGSQEIDQLVSVLERGLGQFEDDPGDVTEFVTLLEELVIEPEDLTGEEATEMLTAFDVALSETTDIDGSQELLDVLSEAVQDPAAVEYEDVERFQSSLGSTLADLAGPNGFGQLFFPPGTAESTDDAEVDTFRIARLAAALTQGATGNSVESGVRAGTRLAYVAANAESPAELLTKTRALTLEELQQAGVDIGDEQTAWLDERDTETPETPALDREQLQRKGERLLSESATLGEEVSVHPAFSTILDQLAADEARILRLLATEGPQPSISVYDRGYVPFRTRLVASNLSRMGGDAGCRQPERTQVYVTNLQRLGLLEFLQQPVEDMQQYQVLEAQPQVESAVEEANWPKTVYGMARLTDFGIEFSEMLFSETPASHQPSSRFWTDES